MHLQTIGEDEATGRVGELYRAQKEQNGFVMEAMQCWTARPDLLPIYQEFSDRIRAGFSLSPRDWRLITFVAAKHVPSTYCSHVYGKQLIGDLGSKETVMAVQRDFRSAGLSERDVAMLAYAETISRDASQVTKAHVERLRSAGFTDVQICDIALCAAFRCFVSRFFDAVGAGTEPAFLDSDADFRRAMTVGYMVRPGAGDYVIKELIPDMELDAQAALDKAIAIAKRGDASVVYLNADLAKIPKARSAVNR